MYLFRTRGLIFRKSILRSTLTIHTVSTCVVHPGTSENDYTAAETVCYVEERIFAKQSDMESLCMCFVELFLVQHLKLISSTINWRCCWMKEWSQGGLSLDRRSVLNHVGVVITLCTRRLNIKNWNFTALCRDSYESQNKPKILLFTVIIDFYYFRWKKLAFFSGRDYF